MTKTLEDMTPEQRTECQEMWCDVRLPFKKNQKHLLILTHVDNKLGRATVSSTKVGESWPKAFRDITPRFDLPRARNTDGAPALEEEEINA